MEPETRTQKPRRSLVGCLFSGSMGCGAFVFGAVVSAALFAPTMLGDVVAKWVESGFGRRHDGRLVIENLQLSWVDGQRANGVKLLDRSGETIVVLNAHFPSLLTILGLQPAPQEWDFDVQRARLEIDSAGLSNLQVALADRDRAFDWVAFLDRNLVGDRRSDGATSDDADPNWAWPSLRVHAGAGTISIADMRQTLEPVVVEALDLRIRTEGDPDRAAGRRGDSERDVVVRGLLEFVGGGTGEVELSRAPGTRDWRGLMRASEFPTRLAGSICSARGRLHSLLGPACDLELQCAAADSSRSGETRVAGTVSTADSEIQWTFLLTEDSLVSVADSPALRILAPQRGQLSTEVTRWLFPWLDRSRSSNPAGGIRVEVDQLSFERGAGWPSLAARAVVTLGELECPPVRAFADDLGLSDDLSFELESDAPIMMEIEGGILRYEDVTMVVDQHRCSFRGQHLLEDDRIEIEIEVPLSFVGQRLLDPGALDLLMSANVTVPIQLVGTWRDPILNINLRVLQEAMSLNLKSTLRDKTSEMLLKTFEAMIPESD